VIIGDHDRGREGLDKQAAEMIGQGEDDLEPLLFGVMAAVAGNPHGRLHLPETPRARLGRVLDRPILDLVRVEDDDPSVLVPLPRCLIFGVLALFPRRPFRLPAYAVLADLDFASFLGLDLFVVALVADFSSLFGLDLLRITLLLRACAWTRLAA
jgi:hypothetical protein